MRSFKSGSVVVCLFLTVLPGTPVLEGQGHSPKAVRISGTLNPGSVTAGSLVTLSGAASGTTVADVNGNYSFPGLPNGNYTINPSNPRFNFQPASQNITLRGSSTISVDFSASSLLRSISINGAIASIAQGSTDQFTATATFSDGSTQDLTSSVGWTSSNPSVATMSSGGVATGVGAGVTNITATFAGVTSNAVALTVIATTLQSITINATNSSMAKGTSVQFTATGTYSDGSTQNLTNNVTWTSSSPAIANISSAGLASGLAIGSANITATQNGITSNTVLLTITPAILQSIKINAGSSSIAKGTTLQFTATGTFSDGSTQDLSNTATWSTSNQAIATVNMTGLATGVALGTSNITATQNGITSNSFPLSVTAAILQSITINAGSSSIAKGTTVQFTATGTFSDGSTQDLTNTATWTSSATAVVSINAGGLASAMAIGSSNITAAQNGITSNSFALAVTAATLQSIAITASSSSVAKGTSVQFAATGTFSDGTTQNLTSTATWMSSTPATVNISASGLATGEAIGTSSITATQNGVVSNTFPLTITAAALQSITISASAVSIAKGTSVQFTATGTFSDGSTQSLAGAATWNSSNSAVANVSATGLVSGVAIGTSNITATQDGVTSNSVALSVTAAVLQSIAINASSSSIAKGTSVQFTATGTFSDGTSQNLTNAVTWASSSPSIANISAGGLATGVAIGTANITATQSSIASNSFGLTVTAAAMQSIAVIGKSASLAIGSNEQLSATGTFSDGSTQNVTSSAVWVSSDSAAVSLDTSAMATAAGVGQSTISASVGNIAGSMTISATASISGTVSAAASAGTTITLSGAASATTTPDLNGNYTFTVLANGAYTITPQNSSYSFVPLSLSATVNNANVAGLNFTTAGGRLSLSPSSFSFGNVNLGSTGQIQAILSAAGGDVTLTAATVTGAGFGVSGITFPVTIASGKSAVVPVTFAPTATGSASGSLSLNNGTTPLATANLAGTGAGLTVTPASLTFGNVADGSTSSPLAFTLNAVGNSVTVNSDSIVQSGGGGGAFAISAGPSMPMTIAAGQSMQINVTFAPASGSPGPATGMVTFASNINSVAPSLSGRGLANVTLAWNASTTPSVTYNVYRCGTSATACVQAQPANFTRIAAGISGLTYPDATVSSGQTYYYALTAVDTSGTESTLSTVSSGVAVP